MQNLYEVNTGRKNRAVGLDENPRFVPATQEGGRQGEEGRALGRPDVVFASAVSPRRWDQYQVELVNGQEERKGRVAWWQSSGPPDPSLLRCLCSLNAIQHLQFGYDVSRHSRPNRSEQASTRSDDNLGDVLFRLTGPGNPS